MKIETKGEKICKFKDIGDCECFKDEVGELFMKRCDSEEDNAVSLTSGNLWLFSPETQVVSVKAKVVIE